MILWYECKIKNRALCNFLKREIRRHKWNTHTYNWNAVQSMSENRTFGFQTAPKSEQRLVRTSRVRILVVRAWALSFGTKLLRTDKSVWNPNRLFGFQTQIYKFTYMCLKSKHFVPFELYVFGFQTQICVWNPNNLFGFQTLLSVRSNLVPNRGGLSEIRTCSDFRRLLYVITLKH